MLQVLLLHMQIVMEFSKNLYLKLKSKLKGHYHPEADHQALAEVMLAGNLLLLLVKKELTAHQVESNLVRLS